MLCTGELHLKMLIPHSSRAGTGLKRAEREVGEPFAIRHIVSQGLSSPEMQKALGKQGVNIALDREPDTKPLGSTSPGCCCTLS